MYEENHSEINKALNFILRPSLAGFVGQELSKNYGADWWRRGVLNVLYDHQKINLPSDGSYAELTDKMDADLCLLLMDIHWDQIFSKKMAYTSFNHIKELKSTRNSWAHASSSAVFDDDETERALNTMFLISKQFDAETAAELQKMLQRRQLVRLKKEQKARMAAPSLGNLKPWRDIIEPHPDVARGNFRQAEFAADLGQVVHGEGSSEYTDPIEFFSRTYLTGGLKTLLVETLKRLSRGEGEPIIQLKTSFGGGKTHSLLALYHLFGGKIRADQSAAVMEVLNSAEVSALPKVSTAVIVGTWQNPLKATLWGDIAEQLAKATGKPELYEIMRENDKSGIAPGVELLKKLFDEAGACLILIDELVAYGRKLSTGEIKGGGTFGNLMSFIQELTEAAKASRQSAVVVSIPESDAEVIDDLGRKVLLQIEKYFGRVEFVWSPITNVEGYEIVRRRLFKPCRDENEKEKVCSAFYTMYKNNDSDFPYESRQKNYREKLVACYPIHPKLFDFLYDKWTGLEKFQKTRGVLRLMASVIHYLWTNNDASAMIMPALIPINFSTVQDELAKLLGGNWDAIISAEVDGERSKPQELDEQNGRFGKLSASRKIARTIFMGTAPGTRKGEVRGVLESEIRLGVIQPQEVKSISIYNDALAKLKSNLYYLYSQDTRLWFGVNPTLRKLVDEKREQFSDDDLEFEIEERLKKWKGRGKFLGVHICPKNSSDVPDDDKARLVILSPKYSYDERDKNNSAIRRAEEILENRGNIPRRYKNMLMFMSADEDKLKILKKNVRDFLAWRAVLDESRVLNLDTLQKEDAEDNLKTAQENFVMKISQAYCRIFAPEQSEDGKLNVDMSVETIECLKEENISATSEKFHKDEKLLDSLGSEKLKNLLNKFIWHDKDFVNLNQLWEYFATYYYLPRLTEKNVLLETVKKGVKAKVFALAENFQEDKCTNLKFGEDFLGQIPAESFLVKAQFAEKQLGTEKPLPDDKDDPGIVNPPPPPPDPEVETLSKYFSMTVELDKTRLVKSFNDYIEEIAKNLMNLPDAETSLKLSITVSVPEGIPAENKDTVIANCHSLKAKDFYFEN